MNRQNKTRTKRKVLSLLIAACMAIVTIAAPTAYAREASCQVEKSNPSKQEIKRDIQSSKRANASSMEKASPQAVEQEHAAKAQATTGNTFDIHISGEYQQAKAYELLRYMNQRRDSEHQLQWDSALETLAMTRAAELSIYYSAGTRPNGEVSYYEDYVAVGYDSAQQLYQELYGDYAYEGIFDNPAITHFAAAAFKGNNGVLYWAVAFNIGQQGNASPINRNYQANDVKVNVSDDYLNWKAYFMDTSKRSHSMDSLQKGKTYYAWIYVYNYNSELRDAHAPIVLETQKSSSSNAKVLTIDKWGTVKAKKVGAATIQVSPSNQSGYGSTGHCVVRPGKVTGLKVTKKSKAASLKWSKIPGASGYQIYRSTKKSSGYKLVKNVGASTAKYTNKGLKSGTKYYYKVRGYVSFNGKKYAGAFSKVVGMATSGKKAVKSGNAVNLENYRGKNFYKSKDLDGVAVLFKKTSGNKMKFDIVDGYILDPGEGGIWNGKTIAGTVKGRTLKFKNVQFYCAAVINPNYPPEAVKMAKFSGTVTFVNSKTIKLKITSGRDYTKYYAAEKKWSRLKPGKTITLKRNSKLDRII